MGILVSLVRSVFQSISYLFFGSSIQTWDAELNFPVKVPGKRHGRYIDWEDQGDAADMKEAVEVKMHNARDLKKPMVLEENGFQIENMESKVKDFHDKEEVVDVYYAEMRELIKKITGAKKVVVFDHTLRKSSATNYNTLKNASAAASPVPRVHSDYTDVSAPRRVRHLNDGGGYIGHKIFEEGELDELMKGRYMFLNVWRSRDRENPVQQKPLTLCDTTSMDMNDTFIYELIYKHRIGLNYSMQFNPNQKWYYYPFMKHEECIVFKTFDSKKDSPSRFCFHTAFDEPKILEDPAERISIEVRTIAFFD